MISILAPTRGRPQAAAEMAGSARNTASDIEILFYVDDDDPNLAEYQAMPGVIVGPRIVLSDCWNRLAEHATGDILHMSADDIRYRTPGWDQVVLEAFAEYPDRIVFVYGRDGYADGRLGTHGFISRRWYETLGYFTWPEFQADYADTWLHDLATRIDRLVYLPDVYTEHLHPIARKANWDQTHMERRDRRRRTRPGVLYNRLHAQRQADAERLEAACFS